MELLHFIEILTKIMWNILSTNGLAFCLSVKFNLSVKQSINTILSNKKEIILLI